MESIRVVISPVSFRSTQGDAGVTSIEYGLIATAIAILVAAGVSGLAPKIMALINAIGT
jgi:Flp pilus assembly pilin Flp